MELSDSFSFLTVEKTLFLVHIIGIYVLQIGKLGQEIVRHLAQGCQLLRDWAGFRVLVSFLIKTAFVLCSRPACKGRH